MGKIFGVALAALALGTFSNPARDQIAVSANDGKQLRPGEGPASRTSDSISVLQLSPSPRILGSLNVPASMIGPPASVAIPRNGRFAIVAGSQRLDATQASGLAPDNVVSVVDLANPRSPKLLQSLKAGMGATGIAINRAGTLALVTGAADDTVSVFSITGKRLAPVGTVNLAPKSKPTDVAFMPDGRSALVIAQTTGKVIRLTVDGTRVTPAGVELVPGAQPSGIQMDAQGRFAYVNNLAGRIDAPPPAAGAAPRMGTISVIDVRNNRVVNVVDAGVTPENVSLSPDGRYLELTIANGSALAPTAAGYNPHGLMRIYGVRGGALEQVAETRTGQQCQGAAWSKGNRFILLQCAIGKEIEVYRFDGRSLTRDVTKSLKLNARPGAFATPGSR